MKVFIWGTGEIATKYMKNDEIQRDLEGFIQIKRDKEIFLGKPVYTPDEISKMDYDLIFVLILGENDEISNVAETTHIDKDKIIYIEYNYWYDGTKASFFNKPPEIVIGQNIPDELERIIRTNYPILYSDIKRREFTKRTMLATYRCAYDDIDSDCNIMQVGYDSGEYQNDYFRFRTFELVANELIQENIEGECAEVGVYKGTFARLINQKFKDRQLYLFDTFDGFDSEEIKRSISDGDAWEVSEKAFKDTSEEIVLAQMPYPDKCVLRKGYFPNTSIGIEDTLFAFVSIDVDLEESIYQSLKFFWPRLSIGGAIFVHDYNNRFFFGTRKGVERFKKETKDRINAIPIADQGGTLIIRK